jgi:hypothetical protein
MNTKFYISKKMHRLLFFIVTASIFLSCQKTIGNLDALNTTTILPDLVTTTSSSASGFVTDENELPVKNATVQVGNFTTTTDKYGFFEAKNVQVVRTAAVVSITKAGYFKGIKTYIVTPNKAAFFRIKLIPKTTAGSFNATSGGVVTIPSGLIINFPASAIVNASTNAAYTGTVNVAAFYINPTAADIDRIMPGDLRGLNTAGEMKLLTSFGMAAVELTGAAGEQLQIATGKKAGLTMPIPTSLSASALNAIPLWSFNETNGLWKEEGIATKTGNTYVGEVSHFSFWNCDVPNNFVQFNCTVVNTAGQPIPNVQVKISVVSTPNTAAYGYTDSSGYVQGAVPNNAQLKLEVFSSYNCTNAVFTQTFITTNVNVAFGNVILNTTTYLAVLNGTVTNCTNNPVTNGYIILQNSFQNTRISLSNTGSYSINHILCSTGTNNITLIAEDIIGAQQSNAAVYPVSAGTNSLPTIQACGVSTTQYVNVTVNTVASNYLAPSDTISLSNGIPGLPPSTSYFISARRFPSNQATTTNFSFNGNNIAVGSAHNLNTFSAPTIPSSSTINTPILVNITEFSPASGQYVAGNFAGVITGPSPTFTPYNITCNFRVQRF